MKFVLLTNILILCVGTGTVSANEVPHDKGHDIASEFRKRNVGFVDSQAVLLMVLKNRQGEVSERSMRVKVLEVPGDGDKNLAIFDTPYDIKGSAFLTYTHKINDDDQWLYLPSIKRVKRIASRNKSGPFMGSEFAYEDIGSEEVEKYTYKYLKDEVYAGKNCFVFERYPVTDTSGYKRQIIWMDKQDYVMLKIEYYDRKDSLLKEMKLENHKKYLGQYWRPLKMTMVNKQNGKETLVIWSEYKFKNNFDKNDFSKSGLKRIR